MADENTEERSGPDYGLIAEDFLKQKLEGMYARMHNPPVPEPKAVDYLTKQVDSYDPAAYKDRKEYVY